MTVFVAYEQLFPETEETRHLLLVGSPSMPNRVALNESYCAAVDCDCRLVRFEAVDAATRSGQATITYMLDGGPTPGGRNPYLEPLADQGLFAERLLDLVEDVIETDAPYRARLERHYRDVKQFLRDHPDHPLTEVARRDDAAMTAWANGMVAKLAGAGSEAARERRKKKAQRDARRKNRR